MDRYFSSLNYSVPSSDLKLTAVTSLFISSKFLEVSPLELKFCVEIICNNIFP